jgi:hypothetical protein
MKDTVAVTLEYAEDEGRLRRPRARVPETMPDDTFRAAAGILTGILAGSALWLILAAVLLSL